MAPGRPTPSIDETCGFLMPKSFPLHKAVESILTQLVRILLKNGVSYGTFADIAKEVFAQVAMKEFTLDNRFRMIQ